MINKFYDFNQNCPVCKKELSFFMVFLDSIVWKGKKIDSNYCFEPMLFCDSNTDTLILDDNFNNFKLYKKYHKFNFYFFMICGETSIQTINKKFHINPYYTCYYRSSPPLFFNDELIPVNPEHYKLINIDEFFTYKQTSDNLEKVYHVNLDYEQEKTHVWQYIPDDNNSATYEKEFCFILKANYDNPKSIINKINSWMIIS